MSKQKQSYFQNIIIDTIHFEQVKEIIAYTFWDMDWGQKHEPDNKTSLSIPRKDVEDFIENLEEQNIPYTLQEEPS